MNIELNLKQNFMHQLREFTKKLKILKYNLASLDVLSESIKLSRNEEISESKSYHAVSGLCTKSMQLNAGIERLADICLDPPTDETQKQTQETANLFSMFSILDELKLNDSQKPSTPNFIAAQITGYIGHGFISHIENETYGNVFLMDVQTMPDPVKLFGTQPKRLSELPKPGEMFGYVFQEKYLVRAVRLEYESSAVTNHTKQYSATLIDIGCTVLIDIKPTLPNHYEVTNDAKMIPSYTKRCQIVEIPSKMTLGDLLHTSVQYQVICAGKQTIFVSILKEAMNPFAVEHNQNWHFYIYFLGNHMTSSALSYQIPKSESTSRVGAIELLTSGSSKYDEKLNPFADPSLYKIETIPTKPVIDKSNPFYFDLVENLDTAGSEKPTKTKFLNFQLTKVCVSRYEQAHGRKPLNIPVIEYKAMNVCSTDDQKIPKKLNSFATVQKSQVKQNDTNIELNLQQNHETVDKLPIETGRMQSLPSSNSLNHTDKIKMQVQTQQEITSKTETSLKPQSPVIHTQMNTKPTPHYTEHFAEPKFVPKIGDEIKILYQTMESVETFYAVIVDDKTRDMQIHEFSNTLNEDNSMANLVAYGEKEKPDLFDTVFALYGAEFYRAKVINIVDPYTFHVFYVDYGNCALVDTSQIFKYDNKWNEYPVYAVRFRMNGIKETNQCDYKAKAAIEKIMEAECDATIVGIEYCEKSKRTTYVVNLHDENGLNIAETLIHKNYASYTGQSANPRSTVIRRRQSKHAQNRIIPQLKRTTNGNARH